MNAELTPGCLVILSCFVELKNLDSEKKKKFFFYHKLKLNADKTDVLVLRTPKQRAKIFVPSISVNGEIVKILNIPIDNLGSVFDPSINMAAHVSKAVKSTNYHLQNIRRIRKYLTAESTKSAVISLATKTQ